MKYSNIPWHGCQVAHSTLCAYIKFSQSLVQSGRILTAERNGWAVPLSWTFTLSQQVWQAQLSACWYWLLELCGGSWGRSWTALSELSWSQNESVHSGGVRAENADIWKRVGLKMMWGVQMPGLLGDHSWAGTLPSIQWRELFGFLERKRCS